MSIVFAYFFQLLLERTNIRDYLSRYQKIM
nr:MAG TPA: hypothetical protein [Caudoviricetes sp.]